MRSEVVLLRPAGERTRAAASRPATEAYYVAFESLGLGYVGAYLRSKGVSVELMDGTIDPWSRQEMVDRVLAADPLLVGFSLLWEGYPDTREVVRCLREAGWTGHVTMGQHFATFNHERLLEDFTDLDSVVRFEGEQTSWELVQALRRGDTTFGDIAGLSWRGPEGVVANPVRPLLEDLDSLPFPARDVMARNPEKLDWVTISGSRGCPWRCRYCSISTFYRIPEGKIFRHRSPKNLVDEIEAIGRTFGKNSFSFTDDQFMGGGKRGRRFVEGFADEVLSRGLDIRFSIENRADTLNKPIFRKLHRAGLERVFMGIESGYQPTLDYYRKDITVEQNLRAIRTLEELGIGVSMGFILFNPRTDPAEIRANLSFLREARQVGPEVFFQDLSIWGGTAMMDEHGSGQDLSDMYTVEYTITDPTAARFRDHMRSLLKILAVPWAQTQKLRALGMEEILCKRFENSLREASLDLGEVVLARLEADSLDDNALVGLQQQLENTATQVQVAIEVASLLTGGPNGQERRHQQSVY